MLSSTQSFCVQKRCNNLDLQPPNTTLNRIEPCYLTSPHYTNPMQQKQQLNRSKISKVMAEPTPAPTPNRAVYGFAWFLFFKTLFVLYVCWAFLPDYFVQKVLGLTYLPDKYFALFLPIIILCALTVFAFLIYPPWNLSMQDDVNNLHTIRDRHVIVRCKHINKGVGKRCENKVDSMPANESNNFNSWLFEKYCSKHKDQIVENMPIDSENGSGDCQINAGFCDCIDKTKCWLQKNPKHLNVLEKRATVPNVCDLDVSDVCKEFFLKK